MLFFKTYDIDSKVTLQNSIKHSGSERVKSETQKPSSTDKDL